MKFDKAKTFPYPVLRPYSDDYMESEFQAMAEFAIEDEKIHIKCSYTTSCDALLEQIALDKASYVSIISCRETYFRQVIKSKTTSNSIIIPPESLKGEVLVDAYIVCVKNIDCFRSEDINPEFEIDQFKFLPGQILAQEETQSVYVDRELYKPISSVFELVKNDSIAGSDWRVSLNQDNVQIEVNPKMKEQIDNARNRSSVKSVLINSIYFSAVVHVLQKFKEGDNFEEYKWGRVFSRQLHNFGIDLSSSEPYVVAQKLMKSPLGLLGAYVFAGVAND